MRFSSRVMVALLPVLAACVVDAVETNAADRIPLRVPEWSGAERHGEIVTSGVPLAKGSLPDERECRVVDDRGNEVTFEGLFWDRSHAVRVDSLACARG